MKSEIISYQTDEQSSRLEVRLEDETVWLTQAQMVERFDSTKQNISLHINNVFREGELSYEAAVKEYLTAQNEVHALLNRNSLNYILTIFLTICKLGMER
jgi:hypothetical protein